MARRFPITADLYSKLTGDATLPIVEVERASVIAKRKRIVKAIAQWGAAPVGQEPTTLGHTISGLAVREWEVFHATAKTALARGGTAAEEYDYAVGTFLQNRHLVVWNRGNLRLRRGGIFSRSDSARTATAGRFGEAVLQLFMTKAKGYKYWDHIPALVERAFNKAAAPHKEQLRFANIVKSSFPDGVNAGKRPDFAFEKANGECGLAEAKGSFIDPGASPSMIKGDFAQGLQQLDAWNGHLRRKATKSFVVGTYLREVGDEHADPSLIAFVDPEGDATSGDEIIDYPDDWIRRGNYGAWLDGMGFSSAGNALKNGIEIATEPRLLPVITLGRRQYAITFDKCWSPWWWEWDELRWFAAIEGRSRRGYEEHIPVFGMEIDTLHAVESSVNNSAETLVVQSATDTLIEDADFPEWFSGSVFPDGSLIGALHVPRRGFRIDREEKFRL